MCGGLVKKIQVLGISLVIHWLRVCRPVQGGLGSIPGRELRSHMPQATKHRNEDSAQPKYKKKVWVWFF